MEHVNDFRIDDDIISKIGLRPSEKHLNAVVAPDARIFEYPGLENVFVMESDLYGNRMPKDSCFLAFNGPHGMIGKHVRVETLRQSTVSDIQQMVEENNEG